MKEFADLLQAGEISPPEIRPDTYVHIESMPPERPKMGKARRLLKSPVKTLTDRIKRHKMKLKLTSWGASGGLLSPFSSVAELEGYSHTGSGDGYDSGISDYQAEMIMINTEVEKLNQVDYNLILWTFKDHKKNPAQHWADKYDKAHSRYDKRKGELLLYLYNQIKW